jgi:hypothetical protein
MPPAGVASGVFNSNYNWYETFTGRVGYVINDWVLDARPTRQGRLPGGFFRWF